ncbi:hypothetical protein AD006_28905 (plasmid) [Pseudonocardia sp. EC080610-09]|uniref:hypothetical protein n=1 Tax=unclassified Pseudonocardia TaxID=2619320 RepID=UPI000706415F|nr:MULTISPECIES: hypothetical protein [unclassified Pseudonocardia]ALL79323.1 hypothetical protein AD006_28905 [Pseudonocardia sp. EC080610-09]ALL85294.1 hypothetical protein AD017_29295 [Pseudonocardia sp. EC080619-01]
MSNPDAITAAVRNVLYVRPADTDPDRCWPDGWCELCGTADGQVLTLVHVDDGAPVDAHLECGETRGCILPACAGADDLWGAPAGTACEPWCPSWAADSEVPR